MVEDDALININLASVERLAGLPGIGEGLAKRIVAYRESVHPFEEVIELTAVPGISERMVRQFETLVTVGTLTQPTPLTDSVEPDEPTSKIASEETELAEPPLIVEGTSSETAAEMTSPNIVDEVTITAPDNHASEQDLEEAESAADEETSEPVAVSDDAPEEANNDEDDVPAEIGEGAGEKTTSPAVAPESETAVRPTEAASTTVFTAPPISRRRGCVFTVLAALFGALIGIGATLGILALLNNRHYID